MQGEGPKQYLPLMGRPLIEWSLEPFLQAAWIEGVVVALGAADTTFQSLSIADHQKLVRVDGGQERADSVLAGLAEISRRYQAAGRDSHDVFVLVHDAARPCVSMSDVERLRNEASHDDGGLLAQAMTDTLKHAANGQVKKTMDRREFWRAQTPQMFRLPLLEKALRDADNGVTDDASAMEQAGFQPYLIEAGVSNLKVTYPEDLALAEFWLRRRGKDA